MRIAAFQSPDPIAEKEENTNQGSVNFENDVAAAGSDNGGNDDPLERKILLAEPVGITDEKKQKRSSKHEQNGKSKE